MIPASRAGVRVVPLVNTTNGSPRASAQLVISTAPGSGRSPWLCRSPSTSVPSMSNTKPRTSRSRASGSGSGTADPPQLEAEAGLVHHQPGDPRARAEFAQQSQDGLDLGVVVPRGGRGGKHRVHLLAGHPEPQQQLLVGDPARQP